MIKQLVMFTTHSLTAHFIYQPPDAEVVEGQHVVLQYKLLNNRFPVYFFRDEEIIEESSHFIQKRYIFSWTLEILNATPRDNGYYHLEVTGTKSKPACLKVKRMLYLTILGCCYDGRKLLPVQWIGYYFIKTQI